MSNRTLMGATAGVAAVLTLLQLLWMYGMMSPAAVLGGTANGAMFGSMIAGWFWMTLALLVPGAILLYLFRDDVD